MKNNKYTNGITLLLFVLVMSLIISNCSNGGSKKSEGTEKEIHESDSGHEEESINLSSEELKEFGVELAIAGSGELERHLDLNGEIVIIPDRMAHIAPRFPGVVKEVRKRIGSSVEKGDVLAIIESNESLTNYKVKSLISGKVIDMHLTLGEVIGGGEGHSFLVADLNKVWVNLSVYQKDLSYVKTGMKVFISNRPSSKIKSGIISYISPIVDENTRTAIARIVLDNTDGTWMPGIFVYAKVIIAKDPVPVLVPTTALENYENKLVIFVKHDEGFVPQVVTIGRRNPIHVEIIDGLKPGDQYVSKGGFTLKTELQKEAFGDEHGH